MVTVPPRSTSAFPPREPVSGQQESRSTSPPLCLVSPSSCPCPSTWPISVETLLENTRQRGHRVRPSSCGFKGKAPGLTRAEVARAQPPPVGHTLWPKKPGPRECTQVVPPVGQAETSCSRPPHPFICARTHTHASAHVHTLALPFIWALWACSHLPSPSKTGREGGLLHRERGG